MSTKYFGKDGAPMDKDAWQQKSQDREYAIIREFDNGEVRCEVAWLGIVKRVEDLFRDMWPLFEIRLHNYDPSGRMKPDPAWNGKTFPTQAAAEEWYEWFLTQWAGAERVEVRDGKTGKYVEKFIETGNRLAAPTAEELAIPATQYTDDEAGAW